MNEQSLRHSGRITKSVPILLMGSDSEGKFFSEETRTVVLSFHGAGLLSSHKLMAEQEITLRSLVSQQETEIRIVGEIAQQDRFHVYGVAFLDPFLNFWQEHFPPPPENLRSPLLLNLECSTCGAHVSLKNGDFESDVCAIHGGLVRYCDNCGFSTIWKRSEEEYSPTTLQPALVAKIPFRPATVAVLEPEPTPAPEPLPLLLPEFPEMKVDKRLHVRAKINYFACIRSEAFGDEIVPCIDMSRGGLSFRTKFAHLISSELRIAVPFSPDAPVATALFVSACVMNIAVIPAMDRYRCGVAFLSRS